MFVALKKSKKYLTKDYFGIIFMTNNKRVKYV